MKRQSGSGAAKAADRHEIIRQHNLRVLLEAVIAHESPVSRSEVARITGLSKPTINALCDELVSEGLLREAGMEAGKVGRPAALIELNPEQGFVVALALDTDGLTVAVVDMTGETRVQETHALPTRGDFSAWLEEQVLAALASAGIARKRVRAVSVSAPGIPGPDGAKRELAGNIPNLSDAELVDRMHRRFRCPVLIENDVNLAALGEASEGVAKDARDFVFLHVDAGIGMGLIVNGALLRGHRGAAGEAGYLPIGVEPLSGPIADMGALEYAAGRDGLLRRYREAKRARGASVSKPTLESLLEDYRNGDPVAAEAFAEEAELLARAVLAASVILDPAFVVLGGAIGAREALAAVVGNRLKEIAPYPIVVEVSALGDQASLVGAIRTGLVSAYAFMGLPAPDFVHVE
jgi:predicted NBD/HSP70 family sugar kinase